MSPRLAFDEMIERTPVRLKLATAADAIEQMADVLLSRTIAWVEDWSCKLGDGPVLDEDLFSELVRQSFSLDLSGLVDEPVLYVRSASEKSHEEAESVVEYREKTEVLAELESFVEEDAGEDLEQLEYDEDVAAWAKAIRGWMERQGLESVRISEIIDATNLSGGKVWIAGLLSDLSLQQTKDFYSFDGLNVKTEAVV